MLVDDIATPRRLVVADGVEAALRANAESAARAAATGAAYGRTTGVGANRNVAADDSDGEHGRRLVRSHATGAGPDLGADVARATMLVRAHQLSKPGSGIPFETFAALVRAADDGRLPAMRAYGGVGTGDITVLGELALALLGERTWRDGSTCAYLDDVGANAALALMSSSAPTLAIAALAGEAMRTLADASLAVTVLSAVAVQAHPQQWSAVAEHARPAPGVSRVAAGMRRLLDGTELRPARTQDPFGWRAAPYVLGPLFDETTRSIAEIDRAIDARVENPRFDAEGVWHHGAFHLTSLGLCLDALRLAATQWFTLSLSRLVKLNDPAYTGQGRFLAAGPAGSSGTMVLEYTAASALEHVRTLADPVSRHTTSISMGTEDHAPFTWRGAIATRDIAEPVRVVLACELVAAVRAVRAIDGRSDTRVGAPLRHLLEICAELPDETADRPLVDDVTAAIALLPRLAAAVSP